jgi:hypothetical protein
MQRLLDKLLTFNNIMFEFINSFSNDGFGKSREFNNNATF